ALGAGALAAAILRPRRDALLGLLGGAALMGLGLAATAGPYVVLLSREAGTITWTRKKQVLEVLGAAREPEIERPASAAPPSSPPRASAAADEEGDDAASAARSVQSAVPPRVRGALLSLRETAEGMGWI